MAQPQRMKELLGIGETAVALGVTRRTINNLIARGELPSVRYGQRRQVPRRAVEAMLGHPLQEGQVALLKVAAASLYRQERHLPAKEAA